MPVRPRCVISPLLVDARLERWTAEFCVLHRYLTRCGVLEALEKYVLLERRSDGYCAVDLFNFLLAMFCWSTSPSIKDFSNICRGSIGKRLAHACGRTNWVTSASLSRMLASVTAQQVEAFRIHVLPLLHACFPEPLRWAIFYTDANNERWLVFDLDAVVKAVRQRGVPESEELPEARRRAKGLKQGYPGRKRGEIQFSTNRTIESGSGLLLGQFSVPGNASMAEATRVAVEYIRAACEVLGVSVTRAVLRMDGAGGNAPCIQTVLAAKMHVVVRASRHELLERPELIKRLMEPCFFPVLDSQSGPTRVAAEFCEQRIAGVSLRTVVAAFKPQDGDKSGAGKLIGQTQFEQFMTDLSAAAFAPEDVVTFYFGRTGVENTFARMNAEYGVNRVFSRNLPGQDLAVLIAGVHRDLRTILGALLVESPPEPSPPIPRPERRPVAIAEPALETLARGQSPDAPPGAKPKLRISLTQLSSERAREVAENLRRNHPDLSVDPSVGVLCPAGTTMRVHDVYLDAKNDTRVVLRAPTGACLHCPQRKGCTDSVTPTYAREARFQLAGPPPDISAGPPEDVLPAQASPAIGRAPVNVGPYLPTPPHLLPAELRKAFDELIQKAEVDIEWQPEPPSRAPPPHLTNSRHKRAHRRHTWAERLARNAADPARTRIILRLPAALGALLAEDAEQNAA